MYVKKKSTLVRAYCLGDNTATEKNLLAAGLLRRNPDGTYAVFSQEAPTRGQIAQPGDYIKIDSTGAPYPNERAWFLQNHTPLGENRFLQKSPLLEAWTIHETPSDAAVFLLENDLLQLRPADEAHFFGAQLWGAYQTAPRDAVVIFDRITRENGTVTAVDFHFIVAEEFALSYEVVK